MDFDNAVQSSRLGMMYDLMWSGELRNDDQNVASKDSYGELVVWDYYLLDSEECMIG
jgi:hypothetical protein